MILDGGLATELELAGHVLSSKLWSAKIIWDSPSSIRNIHLAYLRAGADIITTSSYQASIPGLMKFGYSHSKSCDIVKRSVELAVESREAFYRECSGETLNRYIAGSAGPYGAYLADGSEYTGTYNLTEREYADFHRERVDLLIESGVDIIAFETFPRIDEAEAVFGVMTKYYPDFPFWISFVTHDGLNTAAGDSLAGLWEKFGRGGNFLGIGMNCSHPSLVEKFACTVGARSNKFIIAYPNSGEGFDVESGSWTGTMDLSLFRNSIKNWVSAGVNIIGGCCRTGPETISLISEARGDMKFLQ